MVNIVVVDPDYFGEPIETNMGGYEVLRAQSLGAFDGDGEKLKGAKLVISFSTDEEETLRLLKDERFNKAEKVVAGDDLYFGPEIEARCQIIYAEGRSTGAMVNEIAAGKGFKSAIKQDQKEKPSGATTGQNNTKSETRAFNPPKRGWEYFGGKTAG